MVEFFNVVNGLVREALAETVSELNPELSRKAQAKKVDALLAGLSFDEVQAIYEDACR